MLSIFSSVCAECQQYLLAFEAAVSRPSRYSSVLEPQHGTIPITDGAHAKALVFRPATIIL